MLIIIINESILNARIEFMRINLIKYNKERSDRSQNFIILQKVINYEYYCHPELNCLNKPPRSHVMCSYPAVSNFIQRFFSIFNVKFSISNAT